MDEMLNNQMDLIDFNEINSVIDKTYGQGQSPIDIKDLVIKVVNGEVNFSINAVLDFIYKNFFNEIADNATLIRNLLMIAILSAILKVLTLSVKGKDVGELGFLTCYIVLITILFTSFSVQASIIQDLTQSLLGMLEAAVPLMFSLIVLSGSIAGAYTLNAIIVTGTNLLGQFIQQFLLPVIIFSAVIQMVNYLSNRDILTKFSELIKNVSSFILKGIAVIFMGMLSLAGVAAPIASNAVQKTAKLTMKTIPVIGDVLSGSVDLVVTYAHALKSGTMVAFIIVIVTICAMPIIKLAALIFIYKLTSALIQPICDERVVKCIDTMGNFSLLLLAAGVTVVVMFIFSVVIMLGF